ncbi:PQQ-dependent sugar dehydrogenase [soil metagenome]
MKSSIILIFSVIIISFNACAQKDTTIEPAQTTIDHEVVVDGLDIAWGMTFLPDGSMLITEKSGNITRFKDGTKQQLSGGPEVYNRGQGGLLDIILHPNYAENGWIYMSYSSEEGDGDGGNTAIMRTKLDGNQFTNSEVLYKATPNTTRGQHFGSRMVFDRHGYLYFSIGDRGNHNENPQDITRDAGKIYRIHDDGRIPQDNPFVGQAGAKEAIYSYGHRNAQGMILHPESGEVWVNEHGPQGGDEINIIKKGENYGWPLVTHGENYGGGAISDETSRPDMEDPIHLWTPSIAPSGFAFVTSDKYPSLKGNLLVGALKFQYLEHLVMNGEEVTRREKLLEEIGRVRDVKQAPDGTIYVSVEKLGIVKLVEREVTNTQE